MSVSVEELAQRREEVLAHNLKMEKTRGSGWHPADPGAELRESRGELCLSERPVALQDDDRVYVVGECADALRDTFKAFLRRWQEQTSQAIQGIRPEPDLLGHGLNYQARVVQAIEKALRGDMIDLSTQEWNYANSALMSMNVQVSSAVAAVPQE